MPRTIQADGRTVQVPDDATDQEINEIFGPAPAAPKIGTMGDMRAAKPQSLMERLTAPTPDNPQDSLLRRGANWLSNVGASGISTLKQATGISGPDNNVYKQTADALDARQSPSAVFHQYGDPLVPNPEEISHHKADTSAALVGQAAAAGGVEEGLPPALRATGSGLKMAGGRLADMTAVGSDALDRQFGAKPGRGLSENRIIGATKAGLKTKVDAALGPLSDQRSAVLSSSSAPPTDVRASVDQPFADLTAKVTNPKTGVADPAEVRALTRTRASVGYQQDPFTGQPLEDPVTHLPVERDLEHMSPSEIAQFNSNLRSMGNYAAKDSPLVDQAVKGAGANLRAKLAEVAPESVDLTRQMHNTETAQDILQRQLRGSERVQVGPRSTFFGTMMDHVAAPLTRLAGTATAAGLDTVGSGLRSLADKLAPPGPPVSAPSKAQQLQRPQLGPGAPVQLGPGAGPSTLPPSPVPPSLPLTTPFTGQPAGSTPPNAAGLVERVAPRPGDLLTKVRNPKGNPVQPGVGGVAGPGFQIQPKRLPVSTEPEPVRGAGSLIQQVDAFHGSRRGSGKSIEREGLQPRPANEDTHQYKDPRLYFTTAKDDAAEHAAFKGGNVYKATLPPKTPVVFNQGGGSTAGATEFYTQHAPDRSLVSKLQKTEVDQALAKLHKANNAWNANRTDATTQALDQAKKEYEDALQGASGKQILQEKVAPPKFDLENGRTPLLDDKLHQIGEKHDSHADVWEQVKNHPFYGKEPLWATVDENGKFTGMSADPNNGAELPDEHWVQLTKKDGTPLKSAMREFTKAETSNKSSLAKKVKGSQK